MSLFGGCALARIELPDGQRVQVTSDAFRAYSEDVFLRQNRTLDDLIGLQQSDVANTPLYFELERLIVDACAPLNRYATRIRDGARPGLALKRQIPRAAIACDETVSRAEASLATID